MASITSAQSGPWSATSTWTGDVVPVLGDKVTVQVAHTVTLDSTYSVGDDTATALTVAGTLKASRSASSQLTVRGQLVVTGTLDLGTEADPIPVGVTAKLVYNDSAAMAHAKWGVTASGTTSTVRVWGAPKTGRAAVTAVTSTTVFDVADASGWLVGDWLCLGPTSPTLTTIDWRAITGIAALSGTAARITVGAAPGTTTAVGRDVCNLTRNVQIVPAQVATWAAGFSINPTTTAGQIELGNCEIVGVGASTSVAAAVTVAPTARASVKAFKGVVFHDIAAISGSTITSASLGSTSAGNLNLVMLGQSAVVGSDVLACSRLGAGGIALANGWSFSLLRPTVIGAYAAFPNAAFSGSAYGGVITDPYVRGVGRVFAANYTGYVAVVGGSVGGFDRVSSGTTVGIGLSVTDCNLNGGALGQTSASDTVLTASSNGAIGITMKGCKFAPGAAISRSTNLGNANALTQITFTNKNNAPTAQERYTNGGQMLRDNSTIRHGTSSVQMDCWYAGQPLTYSFTFKVAAGETAVLKGAMRYSTTYGTATPPTVTVSGLGITPVVAACPTSGAATWYDYTVSVTNPQSYPGEFTVTYTGQSAANSTGAYCWFDGVPDSPWVDTVRHFGYLWDSKANRTADSRITMSESAALALAVAVDHTTQVITVTGALTNAQVFQACMADLCQAANISPTLRPAHISSSDGSVFTTTYTVVLSGAGSVSGDFTDATGTRVSITAPALVSGTRVQIYDVTNATQLYNDVLLADGFSMQATWTTNHTIRLRADKDTKLAVTALGVLTSSGLSFLDVQADDNIYTANGIDGSTCTEFSADGTNVQIDISDPDGVTSVMRLYAWMQWYQTTATGIASVFFGAMTAIDAVTYIIDQALADVQLDNVSGLPVRVVGGYLARKDGSTVIAPSSGSIQMDPGKAYLANGSVPTSSDNAAAVRAALAIELARIDAAVSSRLATAGYTAPDNAKIDAIAVKVDELHQLEGLVPGVPLEVSDAQRKAGSLVQSVATVSGVVTVSR